MGDPRLRKNRKGDKHAKAMRYRSCSARNTIKSQSTRLLYGTVQYYIQRRLTSSFRALEDGEVAVAVYSTVDSTQHTVCIKL